MRRLVYILPLAVFLAVAAWFALGLTRDPSRLPSALIDQAIPAGALPPLPGAGVPGLDPAEIKGKVALVNVFASWCVPCKAEHPILMRLARDNGVAIYGINYKDAEGEALAWLKSLGNPYRAIGYDGSGRAGIEWGVYGVPETFVIDKAGRIRFKHVGPIEPRDLENTLLPLIERLSR